MMALLSLREVSFGYGGPALLDHANLHIERGERVCLLGRNGAGKSTMLKLISGEVAPDEGDVIRQQGVVVSSLAQDVPQGRNGTIYDEVASALGEQGEALAAYRHSSRRAGPEGTRESEAQLRQAEHAIGFEGSWKLQQQVDHAIERLSLDPDASFSSLSSGMKRRVLLARALASDPDILLLDEPTNHLDIDAIRWLEQFLLNFDGTLIFVTHDRMFVQRLATRIVEVDRGRLFDWTCDYKTFLKRKEAALEAEAQEWALFDEKLAQEEVWIRQGIKARRTRNEGRVRALEKMRQTRSERRERMGTVRMQSQESERSGSLVIEAKDVDHSYGEKCIVRGLTTTIMRGDRIGIIGPNGSGKTTLLRLLLGKLTPSRGKIRPGTNLEIAYFDQLRAELNEEQTVQHNLGEGNDTITINGKSRHVIGYLQDFLFSPERARNLVKYLSGGERNRLLLAKIFTKPSNVLVLDEPTNDLDAETLELLEELLGDYPGTLLLVSHDRAFLNNVVTSTLVIAPDGSVREYAGGYDDWMRQRETEESAPASASPAKTDPPRLPRERARKLSYKDQRELESLPARIETLEAEQRRLHEAMAAPTFYQQDRNTIASTMERLESLDRELADAYQRWEALDEPQPDR
jgi:ATP-binding cassette subfamily F protein uup